MTNADRFKTAEERAEAFIKYCFKNDVYSNALNSFTWLDLEYEDEDEEPLPCPFCGHKLTDEDMAYKSEDAISFFGWSYHCPECGYRSRYLHDKYAAIAAHNRVARAAKEANDENV